MRNFLAVGLRIRISVWPSLFSKNPGFLEGCIRIRQSLIRIQTLFGENWIIGEQLIQVIPRAWIKFWLNYNSELTSTFFNPILLIVILN